MGCKLSEVTDKVLREIAKATHSHIKKSKDSSLHINYAEKMVKKGDIKKDKLESIIKDKLNAKKSNSMESSIDARVAKLGLENIVPGKSKTPEFDKLPFKDNTNQTMTYAGIGSRETPPEVLKNMRKVAKKLDGLGYTLNSGGAIGADMAFEGSEYPTKLTALEDISKKDGTTILKAGESTKIGTKTFTSAYYVYNTKVGESKFKVDSSTKPQNITNKISTSHNDVSDNKYGNSSIVKKIAKEIHPNGSNLNSTQTNMMARNTYQIFGTDLKTPVDFVLAWTPDGATSTEDKSIATGGTGQAIDYASRKDIPVINMFNEGWETELEDILSNKQEPMETIEIGDSKENVKLQKNFIGNEKAKQLKNTILPLFKNKDGYKIVSNKNNNNKHRAIVMGTEETKNIPYSYSKGTRNHPANQIMPDEFKELAKEIARADGKDEDYYNHVLVNEFADGIEITTHKDGAKDISGKTMNDSDISEFIYYEVDSEGKILNTNNRAGSVPVLSIGDTSGNHVFGTDYKNVKNSIGNNTVKGDSIKVKAPSNSLVIMSTGELYHYVPKGKGKRYSITYRHIPQSQINYHNGKADKNESGRSRFSITDKESELKDNEIFVFGSNLLGIHGKGAAKDAIAFGAKKGVGDGISGQTYAIPTKDSKNGSIELHDPKATMDLSDINKYVDKFIEYAKNNKDKVFLVTAIGTGLAKIKPKDMAEMFDKKDLPSNIKLPIKWEDLMQNVDTKTEEPTDTGSKGKKDSEDSTTKPDITKVSEVDEYDNLVDMLFNADKNINNGKLINFINNSDETFKELYNTLWKFGGKPNIKTTQKNHEIPYFVATQSMNSDVYKKNIYLTENKIDKHYLLFALYKSISFISSIAIDKDKALKDRINRVIEKADEAIPAIKKSAYSGKESNFIVTVFINISVATKLDKVKFNTDNSNKKSVDKLVKFANLSDYKNQNSLLYEVYSIVLDAIEQEIGKFDISDDTTKNTTTKSTEQKEAKEEWEGLTKAQYEEYIKNKNSKLKYFELGYINGRGRPQLMFKGKKRNQGVISKKINSFEEAANMFKELSDQKLLKNIKPINNDILNKMVKFIDRIGDFRPFRLVLDHSRTAHNLIDGEASTARSNLDGDIVIGYNEDFIGAPPLNETLFHEYGHHITTNKSYDSKAVFYNKDANNLYNHILNKMTDKDKNKFDYAMKNVNEFFAEGMSNMEFIKYLSNQKYERTNSLRKLLDVFFDIFKPNTDKAEIDTAYAELLSIVQDINGIEDDVTQSNTKANTDKMAARDIMNMKDC